jgi:uncharacterized damage-inducible protein DinB
MQEGTSPPRLYTLADIPTLEQLRSTWNTEEQRMRAFLATLHNEDLARSISYTTTQGKAHSNLLWELLYHLVLHGMQHRSEAAAMLTASGHSPGWIDFILYLRQRAEST